MFENFEIDRASLPKYILIAAIIIAVVILNIYFIRSYISSNNEIITDYALRDEDMNPSREAAVAGLFYPADVYQLQKDIDNYLEMVPPSLNKRPHILIVPHAGYLYSAKVAAHAYQKILPFKKQIKKVFLLGPSHRVALNGVALSSAKNFKTPLGETPVSKKITAELAAKPDFAINDRAHRDEHALEVQLPFLQKTLDKFSIVPMVYGRADPQKIAAALTPYLQKNDSLLIISADLSHYLDYQTAARIDSETAAMVADGQPLDEHRSCGATGINTAMLLARSFGLKPQLLDITNSGNVTGDMSSVVGYAAWMFSQQPAEEEKLPALEQEVENLRFFAKHNKAALLDITASALEHAVAGKNFTPERDDYPDILFNKGASFVTLTQNGELRGCIGSLLPNRAIALDLADNARQAALKDSRFPPLTAEELKTADFSISLLTGYERIKCKDEEDLLKQLKPGVDGLVIRDGNRQGLFLPSVWKQLPDKKEFLTGLKIKAGLSPAYWSGDMKIYRFRTVEINNAD